MSLHHPEGLGGIGPSGAYEGNAVDRRRPEPLGVARVVRGTETDSDFEVTPSRKTFYDVGANVVFFTLFGARCVGSSGRIVAVEPLPRNIELMEKHLAINDISNVRVVGKAISDFVETVWFSVEGHSTSRLSTEGQIPVEVTTLDALVEELGVPPDLVKVDIEGAEIQLLKGAKKVLQEFRPVVFIAVCSKKIFDNLFEMAPRLEYGVEELGGTDLRSAEFCSEVVLIPAELRTGQ